MNQSEIDQLVASLNNTSLVDSSDEELDLNMPQTAADNTTPNLQLLKMYVDTIPHYNGDPNTLEIFISSCDHLYDTYDAYSNPQLKQFLSRVVVGKLVDRAQILIGTRTELDSWPLIRQALRQSFGDQRNLDCLEQDLITLSPNRGEQPLDFGKRIQIARSRLASKISSIIDMPRQTKEIYLNQYDNLALKTFIRGLPSNLQSIIRLRNPATLEIAMNYVTEEENFRYTQNLPNMLMRSNPPKQQSVIHNQRPQINYRAPNSTYYTPAFSNNANMSTFSNNRYMFPNNSQPNHNFNNFRTPSAPQRFPSQPINIQPKFIPRHYPTNLQVFGPPKNVFKPTGQKPTNEPEPMSTTSRNPTIRQSIRNRFQPSGPRNFISEELHQIESLQEDQLNTEPQSTPYHTDTEDDYFTSDSIENNYYQDYSNNEYLPPDSNLHSDENVNFPIPGPSNNAT